MTRPILSVLNRENPSRKPVWFMRQAGRYLPEYRELRQNHSMLDCIQNSELAAKITLQPLKRFDLDGAIIFADILNPLIEMGVNLDFIEKEGPKIFNPISNEIDVDRLKVPNPKKSVEYTLEALQSVSKALSPQTTLFGFSGAPFTLCTYLIDGKTSSSLKHVKNFINLYPTAWNKLQSKLVEFIVNYLISQVEAGAHCVQLFDSWAGLLSPYSFEKFAMPSVIEIVTRFKQRCKAPIIYFATGTSGYLELFSKIPADGFSIDWKSTISSASKKLNPNTPIQGNLDPEILAGNIFLLEEEVQSILTDSRDIQFHIFNLGHGILPHTPVDNVAKTIELVRSFK